MNTAFLAIIKRIIAEYGESVLADPGSSRLFSATLSKTNPRKIALFLAVASRRFFTSG
jgi:hypothetical protein